MALLAPDSKVNIQKSNSYSINVHLTQHTLMHICVFHTYIHILRVAILFSAYFPRIIRNGSKHFFFRN